MYLCMYGPGRQVKVYQYNYYLVLLNHAVGFINIKYVRYFSRHALKTCNNQNV